MSYRDQNDREARPRTRRFRAVHIESRIQSTDPTYSPGLSGGSAANVSDLHRSAVLLIDRVDQLTELARDRASAFQEYEFRQAECGDYSLWTPLSLYQREQTLWDETIAHSNAAEHPYNWTMMDQG
jgi:hypothetical protein